MWQILFQFSVHLPFISVCLFVFVFDCIMGFQIPNQGWDPHPLHWKCGVLTTEPPGKFITLPFSDPIHFDAHKCSPCGGECSHRQLESNKRDTHHFLLVLYRINLRKVTWWVWLLTHILPLTSPWVQADYACLAYFPKIRICSSISNSAGRSSHGGGGGSALPQWRTMFPTAANGGLSRVPQGLNSKRICLQRRRRGLNSWVRKISWSRKWQPTPVFLPGKSLWQRSLAVYSPWGHKESEMTEWLNDKKQTRLNQFVFITLNTPSNTQFKHGAQVVNPGTDFHCI